MDERPLLKQPECPSLSVEMGVGQCCAHFLVMILWRLPPFHLPSWESTWEGERFQP